MGMVEHLYGGASWYVQGVRQLLFLFDQGMKSKHTLLEFGPGPLTGGIHFLRHLNEGNYYCIEKEQELIDKYPEILEKYNVTEKFTVFHGDGFKVPDNLKFDFIFSQSVFTHIDEAKIRQCLENLLPRLSPGGKFYASYEAEDSRRRDQKENRTEHPFRVNELVRCVYHDSFFRQLAKEMSFNVEFIGQWGHPGLLSMLKITRG